MPDDTSQSPPRRQEERSETMRQRLIDATLSCLETEGYAGTTISKIVARAEVSRGAHVHHFPSKAALIEAAAKQLVRRVYIQLGKSFLGLADSEDRLRTMVISSWQTVFCAPEHSMLLQLLMASRHDPELTAVMQRLWSSGYQLIKVAADHYFEPIGEDVDISALMALLQWLLRGMALDRHLYQDDELLERHLDLWCDLLSTRICARAGVNSPPPRPPEWALQ